MNRRICAAVMVPALVIFLAGCETKLTRQNYNMIMVGKSTRLEVENTLGDKHRIDRGARLEYEDMDRHLTVYVDFDEQSIVRRKQWVDAASGEWHDTKPDPEGRKLSERGSTGTIKKN